MCAGRVAMSPAVEAAAEELAGRAKVYKINVDDYPAVSPRFNILGIPTLILFKDGQVAATKIGALPKSKPLVFTLFMAAA